MRLGSLVCGLLIRAPPRGFREHGNMGVYFQGAGDIVQIYSGNKGTLS